VNGEKNQIGGNHGDTIVIETNGRRRFEVDALLNG